MPRERNWRLARSKGRNPDTISASCMRLLGGGDLDNMLQMLRHFLVKLASQRKT
jgi:hypothetical protein